MAIHSAGTPIKASEIRTELGQTGSLSISSAPARSLAGRSSGTIKYSDFYGKSTVYTPSYTNFMGVYRTAIPFSSPPYPVPVGGIANSDGSMYVFGSTPTSAGTKPWYAKFSNTGQLIWQKGIDTIGTWFGYNPVSSDPTRTCANIAKDSSDNLYASFFDQNYYFSTILCKFDSLGNKLWAKIISNEGNSGWSMGGTFIDKTDNLITITVRYGSTVSDPTSMIIAKHNTNGDLIWQKRLPYISRPGTVCFDSSNNIYISGSAYNAFNLREGRIIKLNSQGDVLWSRLVTFSGTAPYPKDTSSWATSCRMSSAGRLYICGSVFVNKSVNTTSYKFYDYLCEINTSDGSIINSVLYNVTTAATGYFDGGVGATYMSIDTADNIYILDSPVYTTPWADYNIRQTNIKKFTSDLTPLWTNYISTTEADLQAANPGYYNVSGPAGPGFSAIAALIANASSIYLMGSGVTTNVSNKGNSGYQGGILLQLPGDGSLTGQDIIFKPLTDASSAGGYIKYRAGTFDTKPTNAEISISTTAYTITPVNVTADPGFDTAHWPVYTPTYTSDFALI